MPDLLDFVPLLRGRSHEVYGPGALGFAFVLAGQMNGRVLWCRESRRAEQLNPTGFSAFCDPGKVLVAQAADQTDLLAVAEEALRDGAVPLVVMELAKALSLTAGRRLQLAAEAGKSTGLGIIPEGFGSNAAETRWYCAPVFGPADSTLQHWRLIKNKSGTLGAWNVRWNAETRRIAVVSETGE